MSKIKIIRTSTVPESLNTFCRGLLRELHQDYEVVAVSSPIYSDGKRLLINRLSIKN